MSQKCYPDIAILKPDGSGFLEGEELIAELERHADVRAGMAKPDWGRLIHPNGRTLDKRDGSILRK